MNSARYLQCVRQHDRVSSSSVASRKYQRRMQPHIKRGKIPARIVHRPISETHLLNAWFIYAHRSPGRTLARRTSPSAAVYPRRSLAPSLPRRPVTLPANFSPRFSFRVNRIVAALRRSFFSPSPSGLKIRRLHVSLNVPSWSEKSEITMFYSEYSLFGIGISLSLANSEYSLLETVKKAAFWISLFYDDFLSILCKCSPLYEWKRSFLMYFSYYFNDS